MWSALDPDAFPKDPIRPDPSVHQSAIVSDLEPFAIDCFDEVQIFIPTHLAKHDVSDGES
jgi:hypothetical protein